MNRLAASKSPYLRHAAHQKIDWYEWSDEAFSRAKKEDKPVFLSTGAVWCHWCHVMARESFEDEETADMLNKHFVNIKLDRDQRPDIDRRYQQAVAAMGGGSGWPLNVFLDPDRHPFFGGTYFPPEDGHGRPGFKKVLMTVVDFYRSQKSRVAEFTGRLREYLIPEPLRGGSISEAMLEDAVASVLSEFDAENGGFGDAPKFPAAGAVDFLIKRYFFDRREDVKYAVTKTLESMAKGGFYDQLGGGFHRYSVDAAWIVPHFEKMAEDNSWLLRSYLDAHSMFGGDYFRTVSEGIVKFLKEVLSDPHGGFYASQDADVSPDDEGGYFTWSEKDFNSALDKEEQRVLALHLFHERGTMRHDPHRSVLFVGMGPEEIAMKTGIDLDKVRLIISEGKRKLLKAREKRTRPFVDTTLYTSINGMLSASFLLGYRVLGDRSLKDLALKSLDVTLKIYFKDDGLYHCEGIKAMLDDYVHLIEACLTAYEVTAKEDYLDYADRLMALCIGKFLDKESGGFFDTETELLGARNKTIEDMPHPSANSLAIMLLLKLSVMKNNDSYFNIAETALKLFSSRAKGLGVPSASYFCSLDAYYHMMVLNLEVPSASELAQAAINSFIPYETLIYGEDRGRVIPCRGNSCLEPLYDLNGLNAFLKGPF